MKKILAIVLSIVMALAMGVLAIGCDDINDDKKNDDKKETITLSAATSKLDLNKGIAFNLDAKATITSKDFETEEMTETILNISGSSKIGVISSLIKMDNELDIVMGEGEEAMPFLNPRIYIRGNELYLGYEMEGIETTYTKMDIAQNGQDINGTISSLLPYLMQNDAQEGGMGIDLVKDGDIYKADIDLLGSVKSLLEKVENIVKDLSVDTTVGDIYNKLGGDDFIYELVGDTKAKEVYAKNIQDIKDMLSALPEGLLPIETITQIFDQLPDNVEDAISMLNEMFGLDLPAIGDGKTADYLKDAIKQYESKTILDVVCDIGGQEKTDSMKEEIQNVIDSFKESFDSIVPQIKSILESNTIKFGFEANSDGDLTTIKANVAISQNTFQMIMGLIGGKITPFAADTTEDSTFASIDLTITIDYNAVSFADETKFNVYTPEIPEGPTDEELAVAYAGTYKLVSFTENDVTYELGDNYGEEEVIADKVVMVLENNEGVLSYTFVYGFDTSNLDVGGWQIYEGKVSFMSSYYAFTYQYHNIEFGEDGTLTFDLIDTNNDNHVISITLMLEQPIVE